MAGRLLSLAVRTCSIVAGIGVGFWRVETSRLPSSPSLRSPKRCDSRGSQCLVFGGFLTTIVESQPHLPQSCRSFHQNYRAFFFVVSDPPFDGCEEVLSSEGFYVVVVATDPCPICRRIYRVLPVYPLPISLLAVPSVAKKKKNSGAGGNSSPPGQGYASSGEGHQGPPGVMNGSGCLGLSRVLRAVCACWLGFVLGVLCVCARGGGACSVFCNLACVD